MTELMLNLLPPHLQQRRRETRKVRLWVALPVPVVALLLISFLRLSSQVNHVRQEARALELQVLPLRRLAGRHETLAKTQADLRTQIATTRALSGRGPARWSSLLLDIGRLIPEDAWLNSLSIERGSLIIDGFALSPGGVTRFAASLGTSPLLEKVDVEFVRLETTGNPRAMRFRLICRLREEPRA